MRVLTGPQRRPSPPGPDRDHVRRHALHARRRLGTGPAWCLDRTTACNGVICARPPTSGLRKARPRQGSRDRHDHRNGGQYSATCPARSPVIAGIGSARSTARASGRLYGVTYVYAATACSRPRQHGRRRSDPRRTAGPSATAWPCARARPRARPARRASGRDQGQRRRDSLGRKLAIHLRGARRAPLVQDQCARRHERPIAVRRELRLRGERAVPEDRRRPSSPDPTPEATPTPTPKPTATPKSRHRHRSGDHQVDDGPDTGADTDAKSTAPRPDTDTDPHAAAQPPRDRGHRRQPLAGHHRLDKVRAAGENPPTSRHRKRRPSSTTCTPPTERRQGGGLYVGAYHFARPDATPGDAAAEADHFVDTADFSPGRAAPGPRPGTERRVDQRVFRPGSRTFLDRVYARTGMRGVIYVSPSFWSTKMGNSAWFAQNGYQVLWIAHWTTAEYPDTPGSELGGRGWTFWQYTSDGTVPGIAGRVDLDRYQGSDFTRVLVHYPNQATLERHEFHRDADRRGHPFPSPSSWPAAPAGRAWVVGDTREHRLRAQWPLVHAIRSRTPEARAPRPTSWPAPRLGGRGGQSRRGGDDREQGRCRVHAAGGAPRRHPGSNGQHPAREPRPAGPAPALARPAAKTGFTILFSNWCDMSVAPPLTVVLRVGTGAVEITGLALEGPGPAAVQRSGSAGEPDDDHLDLTCSSSLAVPVSARVRSRPKRRGR